MTDDFLHGRTALVTGAGQRLGRAIALALADAGANLAIHYFTRQREAAEVAAEVESRGRKAVIVQADLANADQTTEAFAEAANVIGSVDILINNVGVVIWKKLDELTPDDWQTSLNGTVTATWHACQAALPGMRSDRFGRIVNILDADADALAPVLQATPYKIGKTGSLILTKSFAVSEGQYGITINAVSPGVLDDSQKKVSTDRIPVGRNGAYSDVIHAVLFLLKEESSYINGANIKVAGGYLA